LAFGRIVKVTDAFNEPLPTGYRDRKLIVEIYGKKAVIHLHVPEMLEAKEQARRMYERWQDLGRESQKRPLTVDEQREFVEMETAQRDTYKDAWDKCLKRIERGSID